VVAAAIAAGVCMLAVACAKSNVAVSASPTTVTLADNPLNDGRLIFHTGKDINGVKIVAQHPPLRSNCAACHRADGSGGIRFSDGAVSADLRHRALVTEQRHPYNLALLERAISTGIDNDGDKLDTVMPRWKLSRRDLHDVAEYVLGL
jgi:mono/diheme cytochrome c family protein